MINTRSKTSYDVVAGSVTTRSSRRLRRKRCRQAPPQRTPYPAFRLTRTAVHSLPSHIFLTITDPGSDGQRSPSNRSGSCLRRRQAAHAGRVGLGVNAPVCQHRWRFIRTQGRLERADRRDRSGERKARAETRCDRDRAADGSGAAGSPANALAIAKGMDLRFSSTSTPNSRYQGLR